MPPFEQLVDRIYSAAADPECWPSVLHDIGQSVDALASVLAVRTDRWVGWRYSTATPPETDSYLRSEAALRSQSTPRLIQANRSGFVTTQEVFTEQEYLADPLMTEFGARVGLHHAAATAIHMPTGETVVVHVQRRQGLPMLDADDIARLDAFRPHLARAGLLAARWRLERLRAATEALALVGLPAAVLNQRGRVLVANELAERASPWIAWLPDDRLALVDAAADALLQRAVAELGNPSAGSVRAIPIKARETANAAVVHVVPTTGRARELFDGAFGILVITPVSTLTAPAVAILQALFDLTPSEAKVASAIAAGLSLEQIAARSSLSIETIRAQTKAIFAKTGTNRQSQVVALLAGLPKIPVR